MKGTSATNISIVIPAFQRADLLKWNLYSLAKQNIELPFETIVVNDGTIDETEALCKQYEAQLNLVYLFSGTRNLNGETHWRVPGFANNIGVKRSTGKILVLCCAEMFHVDNTINTLVSPLLNNIRTIGVPVGKNDADGSFLKQLEANQGVCNLDHFNDYPQINVHLPFLMAVSREQYYAIGGYDEDFTGVAADDDDFVERLLLNGCQFIQTEAKTIHLYHRRYFDVVGFGPEWEYNLNLWKSRRGQIVRNVTREWGKL